MPSSESGYTAESSTRNAATESGLFTVGASETPLVWWLRIVGAFYLLLFVMAVFVRLPIRAFGPEGTLALAASGDPIATFVVDTWVMFGLELGVIGIALIAASWYIGQARLLVWTVIGLELVRGIVDDIYMIASGYEPGGFIGWIVIHSVIIVSGVVALRAAGRDPTE